ncbi:FAD binding domain-containing protein [Aeromicrobium fastidiosum]|uniref:FAD-binding PCMH-type domain-containing protein n=1 Tax=Aeromicrobium fastidiosum TaxID=52699 RepID=A0A641APH3_9ACTN|nr:FAD binding domain-containing protein [Aeromicrobium fastidiosum]KAA1378145.1 hypothetical protein ESP62_007115 [Aeromicrobium fastidiosum]MBP2389053.1 carbon-monoxide dehydrogenase medium subunit [Aeromicrobium fastidiosum]
MIPPPFRYLRATTVDDALTMLASHEGAVVLGGGQTLVNALKLDLVSPSVLVDVHRLPELTGIELRDGRLRIGAAVTYATLAAHPLVAQHVPSLATVAAGLVDRQVRNRGTIGGNCCLNDPTSNLPPLLACLDASFVVHQLGDSPRTLSAREFFLGTFVTAASGQALLTEVVVPSTPATARVAYRHQQVGADSWAVARAVVRIDVEDGLIAAARVALGAVPDSPLGLDAVERSLLGRPVGAGAELDALEAFDGTTIAMVGDTHGSAAYRRAVTRVQLRRALSDVCGQRTTTQEGAS